MRITQENRLFGIGFFFSFCIALAAYVNASYLKNFLGTEAVGMVYSATAFLTIVVLYFFEYLGGKYGVQKTLVASLVVSGLAALGLGHASTNIAIIAAFIALQIGLIITKFSTDVLVQTHKNNGEGEGVLRGAYLAITNFSWIIAAFIGGYIAAINPKYIYTIDGIVYIILAIISLYIISQTKKDIFLGTSIFHKIRFVWSEVGTRKVIISEFVLQTFYVTMVIFTPLFLREVHGFSYSQIGLMFAIMLIPFAVLQYPLGYLADKKYGEKGMMVLASIILTGALYVFTSIEHYTFVSVTIILFMSRVGACMLEVMNDTYFFKITKDYKKTLPILKGMAPLSILIFGIVGSTIVTYFSYKVLFMCLALFILVVNLLNIYNLKDTKAEK